MGVFKYLKNSKLAVTLILLLLVIQATCELSLPSYTSEIVDVGIQQKGISEAIPEQISGQTLENLEIFMTEDEIFKVDNLYKVMDNGNYKLKYNDISSEDEINEIFKRSILALSEIQAKYNINDLKAGLKSGLISREQIISQRNNLADSIEEASSTILNQKASLFLQNEYQNIGIDLNSMQINYLVNRGMKMIVFTIIMVVCEMIVGFFASKISSQIGSDLREKLFEKVLLFSNTEMNKFSTASLITRSTNDVQQIQQVIIMILRIILYAPIIGIGGVIKVYETATDISWIIGVAVGTIFLIVGVLFKIAMPKFKKMQILVDKLNLVSRETLTGIQVIRAFNREDYEEERFDKANRNLTKVQLFTSRVMSFMMPMMTILMNVITIAIVWFGSKEINEGALQVGDMMAFITYTMQIVMAFMMITMISIMLPRANVAANRIEEVLNMDPIIKDRETVLDSKRESYSGTLRFNNVSFKYENADEYSLKNISFTAKPGETTAIIGGTGSGKSTIVNLMLRFYDVTEGNITIDNLDIRDISQHRLRSLEGYVPQKSVLFSGDISENIKFGGDFITDEDMLEAAQIAQATEFINQKPEKYHMHISQGGTNVSGGQKQRLSIARAIAKKPKILIFDDSFSALDYKTDSMLRRALKDKVKDIAVIIVAQRISTILNAEQIIVLNDGKIDGIGTHKELFKSCKTYREIAKSQLSEKDLKAIESEQIGGDGNE